jgi:soluble lytic murein transglycosylase-like protein
MSGSMTSITDPLQVFDPGILPILPPNQTPGLVNAPPASAPQAAPPPPQQAPQAAPVLPPQQTPGLVDTGSWDAPQEAPAAPSPPSPSGAAAARLAQAQALTGNAGSPQAAPQAAPQQASAPAPQTVPAPSPNASDKDLNRFSTLNPIPDQFQGLVADAAKKYNVPQPVLQWVAQNESGWNPTAVNTISGATGMMQFMPGTAKQYQIDPTNPAQSIDGAAHYLSDLYKKTGNWADAVAKYGTFSPTVGSQDQPRRQGFMLAMQNAGVPNAGTPGQGNQPADTSQGSPSARLAQAQGLLSNGDYEHEQGT